MHWIMDRTEKFRCFTSSSNGAKKFIQVFRNHFTLKAKLANPPNNYKWDKGEKKTVYWLINNRKKVLHHIHELKKRPVEIKIALLKLKKKA